MHDHQTKNGAQLLGIVDRFIRTFRENVNRYTEVNHTTGFINSVDAIVNGYNRTTQGEKSGIKAQKPNEVDASVEKTNHIRVNNIKSILRV
jgi:hypothetical protein